MAQVSEAPRLDRRTARTRKALREALAAEIVATGDLGQVTVTAVADRAGITRRTFYSHYRDIPDLVSCIEAEALSDLSQLVREIAQVTLPELETAINHFEPCPRSIKVFDYFRNEGAHLAPLLSESGDPAFAEKIKSMVREVVHARASEGFVLKDISPVAVSMLDYYLTFVISAEVGVVVRWLNAGMAEPPEIMARMMTALLFVRPGDLYGRPIDFDIPSMAAKAMAFKEACSDVR
ncbi:MAG: TetR/AcrR family transcriptional regulator C-terminal domain-containing protein [Atopobiaceae bacterium]|nr:TetR/AcrR family transcriptional regulator C-terminal domain-containing protein [Atopobiaceae bacterium]